MLQKVLDFFMKLWYNVTKNKKKGFRTTFIRNNGI